MIYTKIHANRLWLKVIASVIRIRNIGFECAQCASENKAFCSRRHFCYHHFTGVLFLTTFLSNYLPAWKIILFRNFSVFFLSFLKRKFIKGICIYIKLSSSPPMWFQVLGFPFQVVGFLSKFCSSTQLPTMGGRNDWEWFPDLVLTNPFQGKILS